MKSDTIILDVFEIVDYKPVLRYRIGVLDKFIIFVRNNDVPNTDFSKIINKNINERFIIEELTNYKKSDFGIKLTHRFKIKSFRNDYFLLNLTTRDLINLGFKEKRKSFWKKLFDFNVNGFWLWLERIGFVIAIVTGIIVISQFLSNSCQRQSVISPQEKTINQLDSKKKSLAGADLQSVPILILALYFIPPIKY